MPRPSIALPVLSFAMFTFSILSVPGCAARTQQARHVQTSGFLGDYSQLKKGKEGEALLVYINPDADFSKYDKVLIDDVTVWRDADSDPADVPAEQIRALAAQLNAAVVDNLKEDYQIVHVAGPGTMRIRLAITEAAESWVVMDTISTVVIHSRIISEIKKLATGTHTYVGKAGIEGEILDAQTGERLAAAVDRRVGGKSFQGVQSSWDDVKAALEYWAGRLRVRLRELRGGAKENAASDE